MAALSPGAQAPTFTLDDTHGEAFSLENALGRGPVVLAFFKITCPVCQYAFPFYDRVWRAVKGRATFVGVSQNDADDTEGFMRQYGVSFPVLLDPAWNYTVSNAYGITNVPTFFLISSAGIVEMTSVGWSKADVEELHLRLTAGAAVPLFAAGEQVVEAKSG